MTNSSAIFPGGNVDELGCGQDTEDFSNKWFQLTVLLPAPVGPITLANNNIERLLLLSIQYNIEKENLHNNPAIRCNKFWRICGCPWELCGVGGHNESCRWMPRKLQGTSNQDADSGEGWGDGAGSGLQWCTRWNLLVACWSWMNVARGCASKTGLCSHMVTARMQSTIVIHTNVWEKESRTQTSDKRSLKCAPDQWYKRIERLLIRESRAGPGRVVTKP